MKEDGWLQVVSIWDYDIFLKVILLILALTMLSQASVGRD